jgi:predicted regulator of Ras-like GTPase activity (Roadblock/LC7/MglB family)
MAGFGDVLRSVAARVPEARIVMIIGTDGIPVEKLVIRPEVNLEAVAAEYTTLLRSSLGAGADTGLGELREMCVVTERMIVMLASITEEYFLFGAMAPDALAGRARFALRLASLTLRRDLQ